MFASRKNQSREESYLLIVKKTIVATTIKIERIGIILLVPFLIRIRKDRIGITKLNKSIGTHSISKIAPNMAGL